MATSGRTGDVVCPFYQSHKDLSIACESLIPHSICCRTLFKTKHDFDLHFINFCCDWGYEKCRIYLAIKKKYEE